MIIASCCDRVKQLTHFTDFPSQKMCFSCDICIKSTWTFVDYQFSFQTIERENRRIGCVHSGTVNPWLLHAFTTLLKIFGDFWPQKRSFFNFLHPTNKGPLRCLVEGLHSKIHHHHEIHLLHDGSRRLGTIFHEVLAILGKVWICF